MKHVRLGKTELRVTRVGFGGIPIQRLTEKDAIRVVQHTLDLGINFLDTANGYSTSEERIGKAIAGQRDQVIIATKTGATDRAGATEHLELSLRRLGTSYIDLWQFHAVSTEEDLARVLGPGGAMEAAQSAKDAGKVRHIGITSHSMDIALKATASGHFETIQFPFNVITSEPADSLVPLAKEHDVGFIAMKPLAGGLLDRAEIAFKYLLQFADVVPDPGIERTAEIDQIVAIVNGPQGLTVADREEMDRMREELGTRFCRRCQYCQPCPQDIPIPSIMNLVSFGKRLTEEQMFSGWVADGVEKARGCVQCGECEEKCPYGLEIMEMIAENVAFYDELERSHLGQ